MVGWGTLQKKEFLEHLHPVQDGGCGTGAGWPPFVAGRRCCWAERGGYMGEKFRGHTGPIYPHREASRWERAESQRVRGERVRAK